jgi:hypothetical protein
MVLMAHALIPDGLDGALFALVWGDTAKYAAGYSDRAFRAVRIGMDANEVRSILGEPLEQADVSDVTPTHSVTWLHSVSPTKGNYRIRSIRFGADARVVEKFAEYWID